MSKPDNYKQEPHTSYDGSEEEWLQLSYDTQYYYYNKEKRNGEKKERCRKLVEWITEIKRDSGCSICDEIEPVALDFHHINPDEKDGSVGMMASQGYGRDKLEEEIEKCVVLCANCHRKVEAGLIEVDC